MLNFARCCWSNSEAWTEVDCDAAHVGYIVRSFVKLVKMYHWKLLKDNT
jgi:hypothetical protein